MQKRLASWTLAAILIGMGTAPAFSQETQRPPPTGDTLQTFKVDVDVVNLFFNVKDKKGRLVPDLTRDDFEVYEDGQPQTIKYFSADSDRPLTLGLLLDTSVSQERVLAMEQQVGSAFLRDVLRKEDLAFLVSFDVQVELLEDFTNSPQTLREGLERAQINSGGNVGSLPGLGGGPIPNQQPKGTLLYDAIYLASREKLAQEAGRKAMIILTDGYDQGSRTRLGEAVEAAQKADVMCYVLLIADRAFYGGRYNGDDEMEKLAKETGGRMIEVRDALKDLKAAFDQIAAELRSQYSIGYTPTRRAHDGSFREVEIKPKDKKYKVQHRKGYYAQRS